MNDTVLPIVEFPGQKLHERIKQLERMVAVKDAALYGLLEGLDSNHEGECQGLSQKEWDKRIANARKAESYQGEEVQRAGS